MQLGKTLRRHFIPSLLKTVYGLIKYKSFFSPKAEVEINSLLHVGRGAKVGSFTKLQAEFGRLEIADNVSIGTHCVIAAHSGGITIGSFSMISAGTYIIGNNYRYDRLDIPMIQQGQVSKGINIGEDVWVGVGCVILDGANIERGVIVTPNSVVSGKVPANSIVQGNPAKVIFTRR